MTYFFVDYENVHLQGLEGIEVLCKYDKVVVYCRKDDIKRIKAYLHNKNIRASVEGFVVKETIKNAADFKLISDMFHRKRRGIICIISNDKGFDVATNYAMSQGIVCIRRPKISEAKIKLDDLILIGEENERINLLLNN